MTATAALKKESSGRGLSRADYDRYLPMVRRIAMRVARRVPSHVSVADLMSFGWLGVVQALSRGAENDGEEFDGYVAHRARGAMLDHLRSLDPATRKVRGLSRAISRTIGELRGSLGREPEEDEIARALGITLEDYQDGLTSIWRSGMSRLELVDFEQLEDSASRAPDEVIEQRRMIEAVSRAIHTLPHRLQQILALYYQEGCTLREIGAVLEVSESRVSQLHTEAMHRLRAAVGSE
jgi:RNA polymerase sigma factor for flagellar operon FliA